MGRHPAAVDLLAPTLATPLHTCSHRDLQIIWGAILQLFVFFPNFRHFRILNILALAGTTMTAVWLLYEASAQVRSTGVGGEARCRGAASKLGPGVGGAQGAKHPSILTYMALPPSLRALLTSAR